MQHSILATFRLASDATVSGSHELTLQHVAPASQLAFFEEVSHSTRDAKRAPHNSLGSRPHAHRRRSKLPTCTTDPFTLAHVPRGFPSKLAAHARWIEQASKAVQRWKNRNWVER